MKHILIWINFQSIFDQLCKKVGTCLVTLWLIYT